MDFVLLTKRRKVKGGAAEGEGGERVGGPGVALAGACVGEGDSGR